MPRKKVVRSETLVKVKDHPKSKIIKRYASLDDEDTVPERVGYRAPTVTYTGETLTIEFEAYTIDTDGKAEPLPDAKPEPLVIGAEAQPPVPPEDVLDDDGQTVLVPAGFNRGPIPDLATFLAAPVRGTQRRATTNAELLENLTEAIYKLLPTIYPRIAGDVVEIEDRE